MIIFRPDTISDRCPFNQGWQQCSHCPSLSLPQDLLKFSFTLQLLLNKWFLCFPWCVFAGQKRNCSVPGYSNHDLLRVVSPLPRRIATTLPKRQSDQPISGTPAKLSPLNRRNFHAFSPLPERPVKLSFSMTVQSAFLKVFRDRVIMKHLSALIFGGIPSKNQKKAHKI